MARSVRILTCAFFGLLTSIGVAWTIAVLGPQKPPARGPQYRVDLDLPPRDNWRWMWYVNHHACLGHHLYIFRNGRVKEPHEVANAESKLVIHHSDLPWWVIRPARHGGMYHETHAYGLPFLCLARKEANSSAPDFWRIRTGSRTVARHVALPLRPWLPGLMADTACHAILWWPLIGLPGVIRRARRRRRGRCPGCGYDLRGSLGSTCPECGPPRRQTPTALSRVLHVFLHRHLRSCAAASSRRVEAVSAGAGLAVSARHG